LRIFKKKGFTLLEAMISIALLGIAGAICLENYLINIRNLKIKRDTEIAIILAKKKIEELKLNQEEKSGNFPPPYEEYKWEVSFNDLLKSETEKEKSEWKVGVLKINFKNEELKFIIPLVEENEE